MPLNVVERPVAPGERPFFTPISEAQARWRALLHYQQHIPAVSRHLGAGRPSLYRKLKELVFMMRPLDVFMR
jgi:DNA-binding NtrC family response regulator